MFGLVLLILGSGLVLGAWGVLVWGTAKGTSLLADLLAGVLALGMVAYLWAPTPMPVSWARSQGWVTTGPAGIAVAAGVLATALVTVALARRVGLVDGIARRLGGGR